MEEDKANEIRDKVLYGVRLANHRMILSKRKENAEIAISRNGKVIKIKAKDVKE